MFFSQAEQDLHRRGRPEEEPVHAEASQLLAAEAAVAQRDAADTATSFPPAGAQDGRAGASVPLLYAVLFQEMAAKTISLGNCPFVMSQWALLANRGEHSGQVFIPGKLFVSSVNYTKAATKAFFLAAS